MKEYAVKIAVLGGVFGVGAGGGIWAQAFLLPSFASHPVSSDWQFVRDWSERTTVIKETQEVVVAKEEVFARVVERTRGVAVAIQSSGPAGATSGSGFAATSDGFILTVADVVPQGNGVLVFLGKREEPLEAQVLKRDFAGGLALLKVERNNLATAGFADLSGVQQGEELVLVAKTVEGGEVLTIVNQGGVRTVAEDQVRTNIFEKQSLRGSPLFDITGHIAGLALVEPGGRVVAIPSPILREFSGL